MKTFCFDAETDGLYGDVWAIGAIVVDDRGVEVASFSGQIEYTGKNEWVRKNVMPHVNLLRFESARALRDVFWHFWLAHREGAVCVADFGSPVESGLFRACVADDLKARQWLGPYPLHELGTALVCAGIDPDIDRIEFSGLKNLVKHDPVDDARASLACWQKALSEKNQRINELGDENVKMRDALTRILGWRERDRESLGEVLRWIEGEARAGLAR